MGFNLRRGFSWAMFSLAISLDASFLKAAYYPSNSFEAARKLPNSVSSHLGRPPTYSHTDAYANRNPAPPVLPEKLSDYWHRKLSSTISTPLSRPDPARKKKEEEGKRETLRERSCGEVMRQNMYHRLSFKKRPFLRLLSPSCLRHCFDSVVVPDFEAFLKNSSSYYCDVLSRPC